MIKVGHTSDTTFVLYTVDMMTMTMTMMGEHCLRVHVATVSDTNYSSAGIPKLWPVGQKWPAKPQKVALNLSKNKKKNIDEKLQNLTVLQYIHVGLLK